MNRFVLKVTSDSGTLSPLISIYWRWNKRKKEITLFTNQQTNLNCFTYSRCFHCPGNRCRYSIYSITLLHVSWLIFWRRMLSVFGLCGFAFGGIPNCPQLNWIFFLLSFPSTVKSIPHFYPCFSCLRNPELFVFRRSRSRFADQACPHHISKVSHSFEKILSYRSAKRDFCAWWAFWA